MAKICINCGKSMGVFTGKINLNDGNSICTECATKAGINTWSGTAIVEAQRISSENILRMICGEKPLTQEDKLLVPQRLANEKRIKSFVPTSEIGNLIKFSDTSQEFIIGSGDTADIFEYRNIVDYELLQNGTSVSKGSVGSAIVGGLLFGAAGAVVGAAGSKRTEVGVCTNLSIKITLRDTYKKVCYITFIKDSIEMNTETYVLAQKIAQHCMSYLKIACDIVEKSESAQNAKFVRSNADELRKFKELFDEGIITEEEYNAKKNQLLGL